MAGDNRPDTTGTATSRLTQARKGIRRQAKARLALSGPSGSGKALRNDQPVLTPDGWVPIGELAEGDTVYGADGQPCAVTGVFPQGVRPLFEVVFSDGTVIVADEDHRWLTQTVQERADHKRGEVRTTADILATLRVGARGRANHYAPMALPAQHPVADLPIDPYVLGCLIGDGGMSRRGVVLSCPDAEIVEAVRKVFALNPVKHDPIGWQVIGGPAAMREVGMLGKRSDEKAIPPAYLLGSPYQRLSLLQGLCDTDGHASGHTCEWTTTSEVLAEQFVELVQSLGGTVTVSDRLPTFTYKGERRTGRRSWRCYVSLPAEVEPFRLTRKAMAYTPRSKYPPRRQIVDVRPVAEGLATCISVDSPDRLFLTVGYVPTHNTWTALSIAEVISPSGSVLIIDTEPSDGQQGAAELYADRFSFDVIEWKPPYDPRDLALTITQAGANYEVVIIDSASHFWRGPGGTLDIADGRFGGWKTATPVQDAMVEAILRCRAHVICCTRAKQSYEVTEGPDRKQTVVKLGLAPIQRDDLEYEFQVVAMIDATHRIDIGKTRAAPLAGQSYPANTQDRFAREYRDWLDGGAEPARQADVDALKAAMDASPPTEAGKRPIKQAFAAQFGHPDSLLADHVDAAWAFLASALEVDPHPFEGEGECRICYYPEQARWHVGERVPVSPPEAPQADAAPTPTAEPETATGEARAPDPAPAPAHAHPEGDFDPDCSGCQADVMTWVAGLTKAQRVAELAAAGLETNGSLDTLGARLASHELGARAEPKTALL